MALRARYCQGFETKVWSWFWSIFSLKTLRLNIGKFFELEVWSRLWGRCLVEKCWYHLKARHMRDQNEFCPPQKYTLQHFVERFFYMGVVIYAQIHKMLLKYLKCCSNLATLRKCAYLNNILRIWATFCIEEDNLQKGNAFWGETNYKSVRKSGGRKTIKVSRNLY